VSMSNLTADFRCWCIWTTDLFSNIRGALKHLLSSTCICWKEARVPLATNSTKQMSLQLPNNLNTYVHSWLSKRYTSFKCDICSLIRICRQQKSG